MESKKTEITNKSQWLELLGDVLGEQLVRYNSLERDELWKKKYMLHMLNGRSPLNEANHKSHPNH